mgnify:CR=1 FL=1
MAPTITITRTTGTRALMTALFAVIVLLATRTIKNVLTGLKTARQWLQTQHEFYGSDGDPIKCTGWQFVGYNIIAAIVAVLLCIKY